MLQMGIVEFILATYMHTDLHTHMLLEIRVPSKLAERPEKYLESVVAGSQ